jgi:hypothetical protein
MNSNLEYMVKKLEKIQIKPKIKQPTFDEIEFLKMGKILKQLKIKNIICNDVSDEINDLLHFNSAIKLKKYHLDNCSINCSCHICSKKAQYININTNQYLCWKCAI